MTEKKGLQLEALDTFTDVRYFIFSLLTYFLIFSFHSRMFVTNVDRKVLRKAGEQWLVTFKDASTHIPAVQERVVGEVNVTTLTSRQYCVVVDPVDEKTGKQTSNGKNAKEKETQHDQSTDDDEECDEQKLKECN